MLTDALLTVHATCVLLAAAPGRAGGEAAGVLLRGPSGSGKSDLALRLIDEGARLVADDRVILRKDDGEPGPDAIPAPAARVVASAPAILSGLLEVRGVGIVALPAVAEAAVDLVVDLVPRDRVERLPPEDDGADLLGVRLPRLALAAFDASTPAKLRLAVRSLPTLGSVPIRPLS